MKSAQRILIIQTAFIGDVILATALIESLKAAMPDVCLDILVRKGNEALLADHPHLNDVLIWNKKESKLKHLLAIGERIRKTGYDVVINCQRFASSGYLTWRSGAKERIGFDKNPWRWAFSRRVAHLMDGRHEVERNHQLISHLVSGSPRRPKLYPTNTQKNKIAPLTSADYICIAPTSVWTTKQWPAHKWSALIDQKKDYRVYLLGAPGDKAACEAIMATCQHTEVTQLCGQLDLLESAALMSGAVMNYVNDSAPLHLASATNAPVRAIFCSTVPDFGFTPLSDDSKVIEVDKALDCRPCGVHGHKACPLGHFNCAEMIDVRTVANS